MKLITKRTLIIGLPDQWGKEQGAGIIPDRLRLLNLETVTAKEVIDVLEDALKEEKEQSGGEKYTAHRTTLEEWLRVPDCLECNQSKEAVVELGELPYYDSATVTLCVTCLKEALALAGVWCDGNWSDTWGPWTWCK